MLVTNCQNKQTLQIYNFFRIMHSFRKTNCCKKLLKRNLEYESILYNSIELSVGWTSTDFQNQTILFSANINSLI